MKYFFIGLVFCLCVFVGYIISKKFAKRKKFFEGIIAFADKLSLDINFSRERLRVLIENFDLNQRKNLLGIDVAFLDFLDKKGELSNENVFKRADVLKSEERVLDAKGNLISDSDRRLRNGQSSVCKKSPRIYTL